MSSLDVSFIDSMGSDLTIVNSARVSFGKKKHTIDKEDEKLIKYLAKHKHFTPFEHCSLSVKIKCPLYIRSQIMRHRTFSYNEISRRYTDENIEFYQPETYRSQHESSKQCSGDNIDKGISDSMAKEIENFNLTAQHLYARMVSIGVAKELARGVLPQSLMTEFYMTGNLRNWMNFIKLRDDSHAQLEVQEIAKKIGGYIRHEFPLGGKALLENV